MRDKHSCKATLKTKDGTILDESQAYHTHAPVPLYDGTERRSTAAKQQRDESFFPMNNPNPSDDDETILQGLDPKVTEVICCRETIPLWRLNVAIRALPSADGGGRTPRATGSRGAREPCYTRVTYCRRAPREPRYARRRANAIRALLAVCGDERSAHMRNTCLDISRLCPLF